MMKISNTTEHQLQQHASHSKGCATCQSIEAPANRWRGKLVGTR